MEDEIPRLAVKQHGNVTYEQLLGLGLTPSAIHYRARRGLLHRVHRGVYAVGRPATTPLEQAAAAVLACSDGAALCCSSAMTLWGFWKHWDAPFEVVVASDRRPAGIRTRRFKALHRCDVRIQHGIRTTSPARTLHDMAPRLTDKQLTRAVNNALHTRYLTESQLQEFVSRHTTSLLNRFADISAGLTRSELEDAFLAFCEQYGLPRPQTNVLLNGYLADVYFSEQRVIVELDSWQFHSSRIDFEKDRDRDADQLVDGIPTVRITYERLTAAEADRLRRILARRGSRATLAAPAAHRRAPGRPAR
jgi:predicted transcriptional regulator of viral defense system